MVTMKKVATQNDLYEVIIDKISSLDKKFEERFTKIDERFTKIDERFTKIDERFNEMNQRFNTLEEKVDVLGEKVDQLGSRVYFIEKTTLAIRDDIKGVTSVLLNHEVRIGELELA